MKNNNLTVDELVGLVTFDDPRFAFTPSSYWDDCGESFCQPPTWIRPTWLAEDMIDDYIQVVGHTTFNKCHNNINKDLWCCDALAFNSYLIIYNGEFIVKMLE